MLFIWLVLSLSSALGQELADYRLPKDIDSIEYKITLKPDLKNSAFSGKLAFVFKPLRKTEILILNSKELNFIDGSVKLFKRDGTELPLEFVEEDKRIERIFIKPKRHFLKGELYELCLDWTGIINEEGIGLYSTDYLDQHGNSEMLVSQLRPVHARRVFPCLDEPSFRAHFRIKVIHDPEYKAVSNTPVLAYTNLKSGRVLTEFEQTPPIPAFLVALILSKMPEVEGKLGFIGMAIPDNFQGIKYSVEIGPKMASAMQAVTAITYPLNKTHQVALPKLIPVAMENWGLYSFREGNILYVEGESPTVQKQTAARFSGHEICHAWIGNMVSLGWWDYLWMSEVFAMYYEYILPHMVDNCWRMDEQMVIDLHQSGLLDDSVPVAPLTTQVLTPEQISNKFSGITYTKGPGVLRMAIHILGQQTYINGFRKLLFELAYNSLPNPTTLWSYLSYDAQNLPTDLATIMNEWTVSSGYPVVNVAVSKNEIVLSQSKFALDEKQQESTSWWIPLSYTTKSECDFNNTKPKLWFRPEKKMIKINEHVKEQDWVLFNIQSAGFYRVNYDLGNWELLVRQLYESHLKIIPLNRAQLIDDSLNLARAGRLPYKVALSLGGYLSYETDLIPWRSAIRGFSFLRTALLQSGLEEEFDEYLCGLVATAYEKVGWAEQKCDDHTTKVNREEIVKLACETGHKPCLENALEYVQSVINGRPKRVSVDVRETALCSGISAGSDETWTSLRSIYETSTGKESASYLNALACRPNSHLINRFLLRSLKKSNVETWNSEFLAFASKRQNADILLNILNENQEKIKSRIGAEKFAEHLKSISQFLTTESQQKTFDDIGRKLDGLEGSRTALNQRISWRTKFLPQIRSFFDNSKKKLVFSD